MLKLFDIFKRKPRRAVSESDFGRRFGWFIERDGQRIGELEYFRWDSVAQFWHDYRLTWRRPEDAVIGPEAWIAAGVVLRNRRYSDVVVSSFMTAPQKEPSIIRIRGASVPTAKIQDDAA